MLRKNLAFLVLAVLLLLQTSPTRLHFIELSGEKFAFTEIGGVVTALAPALLADLNQDGKDETLWLNEDSASITEEGSIRWQSPQGWEITQAEITNLNHDSVPEAALLVWRPFRTWPVDRWLPAGGRIDGFQDEKGYSCQIILIGWKNGGYQEVWAGSALAEPVRSFRAADLNGDGRQELITLEGKYEEARSTPAHFLKAWQWDGFGFSNLARMEGVFSTMTVVQGRDGRIFILIP